MVIECNTKQFDKVLASYSRDERRLHKTSTTASSDYDFFGFSEIYFESVVSSPTLYTGPLGFHTNNSSGRDDQGEIISKFYQPSFISKGSQITNISDERYGTDSGFLDY